MPGISAAAVKQLRDRTGLPMMDCKQALEEAQGDADAAVDILRKRGAQIFAKRSDRETDFGRFGLCAGLDRAACAMVEVKCESAPVAGHDEFIEFANAAAEQLANGPGAATADELLEQPSPAKPGMTLREHKDDLFNRMREVIHLGRMVRIEGPCGGYSHNAATVSGVLTAVTGGPADAVHDICLHVTAMRPQALRSEDLDPAVVAKEREILAEAARQQGKPQNVVEKIVEGQLRNFFAQTALLEQAFVKEPKLTVGQYAQQHGFDVKQFVLWELGKA